MTHGATTGDPAAGASPASDIAPDAGARSRRTYLIRRRQELLAPIRTVADFAGLLLADPFVLARPRMMADLGVIRDTAARMERMIEEVISPTGTATEAAAKALNHDLRGLLTILIGYGDELVRAARKDGPGAGLPELDQVRGLAARALALVESTVTSLRGPGDAPVDDVQVYLDRLAGPADPAEPDRPDPHAEPGRILVADDCEAVRDLLCDHLRRRGHEVVAVRDGMEALLHLNAQPFDLVLVDLEMPRANGFHVLDHVKGDPKLGDTPVIVISGHGELDAIAHCIKRGAEEYLPKPFNRVILQARVDACLEKKRLRDRNEHERRRYNDLLHAILPGPIVAELADTDTVQPRRREEVAVLFADIVGFTPYCDRLHDRPELVVRYLRHAFEAWEEIAACHGVQKIKTIGDAFMAAAGLLDDAENPVLSAARCGLRMIEHTRGMRGEDGLPLGWDLRVGVHIGPVVAGVLGRKQALYDLWGDTVNVAARLESHGRPGCVNLSAEAWDRVVGQLRETDRSTCQLKGKPAPMAMIHVEATRIPD